MEKHFETPGNIGALAEESYQTLPSLLLNDLSRANKQSKARLQYIDIAVYALLKAHARNSISCYPSYKRIATLLGGCGVSTVQRSLRRLEEAGHIQRKKRGNKGKIYILTDVEKNGVVRRQRQIEMAEPVARPLPCLLAMNERAALADAPQIANVPVMREPMEQITEYEETAF